MKKTYLILTAGFFIVSVLSVNAQNFYNKTGTTVSITNGATLSVMDSLINQGNIVNEGTLVVGDVEDDIVYYFLNSGELLNNGNLVIRGTWLNQGTYDAGEGEITFSSTNTSVPQIINHNNQSFSKLVISGGGFKQILADLTVEESLTLTDGVIIAQNNSKVHISPTAVVMGGSDASHINASVYQEGSGTKIFPIGNGTTYLPVEVNGIASTSEVGITLRELQAGQTLQTNSSLEDISGNRYWEIDVASGSLEGARIILPVEGDEGLDAAANERYVVAYAPSLDDDFLTLGRSTNSTSARVESELSPGSGFAAVAILSENRSIVVFNAISPNPDDEINSFVQIDNLVETDLVSIYNRWGDLVFEMKNYQNNDAARRFNGQSNVGGGKDLPTGTYFYVIRRKAGEAVSGYISLRR